MRGGLKRRRKSCLQKGGAAQWESGKPETGRKTITSWGKGKKGRLAQYEGTEGKLELPVKEREVSQPWRKFKTMGKRQGKTLGSEMCAGRVSWEKKSSVRATKKWTYRKATKSKLEHPCRVAQGVSVLKIKEVISAGLKNQTGARGKW